MKKKIIVSALTTFLCIPLFMWTPLAEPKNVYNTPYGTYTTDYTLINSNQYGEIVIGPFVIYAVDKNVSTFKYQFNNYYTGTVTINTFTNINPTDNLASYKPEMFTDNCTILSYTNSSVTFYIKNVKEFSATIVYPTGNAQFNIQAWANPGTTNITVSQDVQTSVNQILSYVQFINEDTFSIAADVNTIRNKLNDALGYGTSNDTIETDFDTLITAITDSQQTINDIETNLINMDIPAYSLSLWRMLTQNDPDKLQFNDYGKYVTVTDQITFENYIRDTEDYVMIYATGASNIYPVFTESDTTATVVRTVRSYNNYFYVVKISTTAAGNKHFTFNNASVNRYIYPYYYGWADYIPSDLMSIAVDQYSDAYTIGLNDIKTAINNLQYINNIKWNSISNVSISKYKYRGTDVYSNYNNETLSFTSTGDIFLMLNAKTIGYARFYKLTLPMYYYNTQADGGIKLTDILLNNGSSIEDIVLFYTNNTEEKLVIYFAVNNSQGSNSLYLRLKSTDKKGELRYREGITLEYIDQDDINYWKMIDIITNYQYKKESKSLLQGIIDAINGIGLTDNRVDPAVNTYNQNINQVYNLEDQYKNQFDTYNQQFTPSLDSTLNSLTDTTSLMNNILTNFNGIQLFTVPITIALVGIVLLAILG